ncbi:MAG: hypothetical protein K9M49_00170 [Candidatus Marinimicrobia bacterium]|nr:hypothetical protein [Candidatus Neomarinimicrobiota bacterium]MCF7903541.1 hypothetical protein [Candidatus Neomarinimicrobiota bacterium]
MRSRIIAYSVMILLLSAHFSRAGSPVLMVLVLGIPFLFFIKKSWVIQMLQVVAYAGTIIWLFSTYEHVIQRVTSGDDWLRLMIIMFTVAVYTAWTGYFLTVGTFKENYGIGGAVDESKSE